ITMEVAMTQEDLNQIRVALREEVGNIVREEVRPIVREELKPTEQAIQRLEHRQNDDFHYLNQKIDTNHKESMNKIDQVISMVGGDFEAFSNDVQKLARRVTRLENSAGGELAANQLN